MKTTTITESIITDSRDPIFSFTEDNERLVVTEGVTLSNDGYYIISVSPYGKSLSNLQAEIDGTVRFLSDGISPVFVYPSSMHLSVGASGRIVGAGVSMFEAVGDSSLVNDGLLHADWGYGVLLLNGSSSIENRGTIFGEVGGVTFGQGAAALLINHGLVEAGDGDPRVSGIGMNHAAYSDATSTTVVNDGSILTSHEQGAGIMIHGYEFAADPGLVLFNSGTVTSTHYIGVLVDNGAKSTIVNHGTISGAEESLHLSDAADNVTNDGHLVGRAVLRGGNDVYHGEHGSVSGAVWGQGGNDLLVGGASADVLGGGSGNDTVTGGAGNDILTGAAGVDTLSGGAGADVFRFTSAQDAAGDRIVASDGVVAFQGAGVAGGDRIDLSAIDANPGLAGQQHFSFGTSHGVGDLWAVDVGEVTHIRGNIGTDLPEFDLAIHDRASAQASDYAAIDFIL